LPVCQQPDMLISSEWESTISQLLSEPGVTMVVGETDAGKTSFCAQLARAGFDAGVTTAVVDADVGQSEIGAPGTIGMATVDKSIESLSELKPRRLYFVGATSPAGHMLECAVGSKKLVDAALNLGARLVVLDTTGLVTGHIGRKLKTYKADLVRPAYIVGLQRKKEIEHLLIPFAKMESVKVLRVQSTENARVKPPELRAARRQASFHRHFHDALGHIIRLDEVSLWNTWFCSGRPLKWQYMKFIEDALGCRVLHAEVVTRGLFIVAEKACRGGRLCLLQEQFKTEDIKVVTADLLKDLLVGLADESANTLDVGLVQAVDFKQRFMFVLSHIRTVSPVRVVQFGALRVTKEGKELETLKPGVL